MSALQAGGAFEVALYDSDFFTNASNDDLKIRPILDRQRILIGTTSNTDAALMITSNTVFMNNNLYLYSKLGVGKSNLFDDYPVDIIGNTAIDGSVNSTKYVLCRGLQLRKKLGSYYETSMLPSGLMKGFSNDDKGLVVYIDGGAESNYIKFLASNIDILHIEGNGNVGIGTSNPAVSLDINTKDAMRIPTGNTAQRPAAPAAGYIRYNTTLSTFEGYGSAWGSLGGVKDTNQDTYISAESYPTSNDDILKFFNSNNETLRIMPTGRIGISNQSPSERLELSGGNAKFNSNVYAMSWVGIGTSNPSTNLEVVGSVKVNSNLEVLGNMTVRGTTTTVDSQTVVIKDNIIQVNAGASYLSALQAGLEVNRGTGYSNYYFVYDEPSGYFKVGSTGSLQTVATRDDSPGTSTIPYYDSSKNKYTFSNNFVYSGGLLGVGVSNPAYRLDVGGDVNFTGMLRQNGAPYIGSQWSNNAANVFLLGSNVGIGTSTPAYKLDISNGLIRSYGSGAATGLVIQNDSLTSANMISFSNQSNMYQIQQIDNAGQAYMRMGRYGNTDLSISGANGYVGVGRGDPAYRLDVAGTGRYTGTFQLNDGVNTMFSFDRVWGSSGAIISANAYMTGAGYLRQLATGGVLTIDMHTGTNSSTDTPYFAFNGASAGGTNDSGVTTTNWMMIKNGNLGVGVWDPADKVHIKDGALRINDTRSGQRATILLQQGGLNPTYIQQDSGGNCIFENYGGSISMYTYSNIAFISKDGGSNVERMRIQTATGNVGIGTTAPSAPLAVQTANNTGGFKIVSSSGNGGDKWWLGYGHGGGSTDANDRARIGVEIANGGSGKIFFTTGLSGSQTEKMRIDEFGNVGIGTSTPQKTLEVASTGNSYLRLTGPVSSQQAIEFYDTATRWVIYKSVSGTDMRWWNGSADVMTLLNNGNLGIGTTAPGYKLDVVGDINASGRVTAGGAATGSLNNPAQQYTVTNVGISSPVAYYSTAWTYQTGYMSPFTIQAGRVEGSAFGSGLVGSDIIIKGGDVTISGNNGSVGESCCGGNVRLVPGQGYSTAFGNQGVGQIIASGNMTVTGDMYIGKIYLNDGYWLVKQGYDGNNYNWDNYPCIVSYNHSGEFRVHGYGGYGCAIRCDGGYLSFTGCHEAFRILPESCIGLIVIANGRHITDTQDGIMLDHITVMDALPVIDICTKKKDKRVYGVLSEIKYHNNESNQTIKKSCKINSIGEGGIWVTNSNGPLENGDYITSSDVHGYGEKQDECFICNYTVAKITQDCNFKPQLILRKKAIMTDNHVHYDENGYLLSEKCTDENGQDTYDLEYPIRYVRKDGSIIRKEEYDASIQSNEEVYIAAFVGCTYHCG